MKIFSFLFILAIVSGCFNQAGNKTSVETEPEAEVRTVAEVVEPEDELTVDTFVLVTEEQKAAVESKIGEEDVILDFDDPPRDYNEANKLLEAFVTKKELEVFRKAPEKYVAISTDTALINFYLNDIKVMKAAVYEGMHKSHPEYEEPSDPAYAWKWITRFYPYLYTEWMCSECESEAFVSQTELIDKAKSTNGNLDDIAFSLPVDHYLLGSGNAGCDYCDYWILGDGSTTELIRSVIIMERASSIFDEELRSIITVLVDIDDASIFGVSKKQVLEEIAALEILEDSTKFDLSNIHKLKKKLSNPDEKVIYEATDAEDFQ